MNLKQSKNRLESFSDAIIAFAATLVVVSLDVPDNFELLKENLSSFVSFAISFFALIWIWIIHNNFFRRIKTIDNWILAMNMILLFVILFFVYPLKFLTNLSFGKGIIKSADDLSLLFQLYGLGFVLIFSCFALMYYHTSKKEYLCEKQKTMSYYSGHFLIYALVGILSIVIANLQFGIRFGSPGFIYALIGPLAWWHGKKYGKNLGH